MTTSRTTKKIDAKLIKLLKALQTKGSVADIHVVRAMATALIENNPSSLSHLAKFKIPHTWVQSVYRRIGCSWQNGTTARPTVPNGLYSECEREYLADINGYRLK